MNKKQIKGFTLVELIIVIVILAILATIAFMTFSNQSSAARDSKRVTELREISSAIEKEVLTSSKFPLPTNPKNMEINGNIAFIQGTFGKDTFTSAGKLSQIPTDPLYGVEYTYSVTQNRTEYEIAGALENEDSVTFENPFIDKAYAICMGTPACGIANGVTTATEPSSDLCEGSSFPSSVILNGGNYEWTCDPDGGCGGSNPSVSCSAPKTGGGSPTPTTGTLKRGKAVVMGNYNLLIAKTENAGTIYLYGLPSIISADYDSDFENQIDISGDNGKTLVYDKFSNIPASYKNTGFIMSGTQIYGNNDNINNDGVLDNIELWKSVPSTDSNGERKSPKYNIDYRCIAQNMAKLYNGVPMTSNPVYSQISSLVPDTIDNTTDVTVLKNISKKGREVICGYLGGCKGEESNDTTETSNFDCNF